MQLLSPFGILISALLASSVAIKNMQESKKQKDIERTNYLLEQIDHVVYQRIKEIKLHISSYDLLKYYFQLLNTHLDELVILVKKEKFETAVNGLSHLLADHYDFIYQKVENTQTEELYRPLHDEMQKYIFSGDRQINGIKSFQSKQLLDFRQNTGKK